MIPKRTTATDINLTGALKEGLQKDEDTEISTVE
jgi:hypothetical protein